MTVMEQGTTLELGLRIGDPLLMQPLFGAGSQRYRARFVGAVTGTSLIVRSVDGENGLPVVKEGEAFAVRSFVGDCAIAFTCSVLRVCSVPYPYLHLTYPQRLEQVVVRRAKRFDLELPGSLVRGAAPEASSPVTLLNLSIGGALLAGAPNVARVGEAIEIATALSFEGLGEQPIKLGAVIRNIKKDLQSGDACCSYGVEFRALPLATELALRAFVFERIVSQGRN